MTYIVVQTVNISHHLKLFDLDELRMPITGQVKRKYDVNNALAALVS